MANRKPPFPTPPTPPDGKPFHPGAGTHPHPGGPSQPPKPAVTVQGRRSRFVLPRAVVKRPTSSPRRPGRLGGLPGLVHDLGHGSLESVVENKVYVAKLVLADDDLIARLDAGAVPVRAVITWSDDHGSHVEHIGISEYGPAERPAQSLALTTTSSGGPPRPHMWAMELDRASAAPIFTPPPGSSPANAWCFLFPWLSFCKQV